MLRDNLDEKGGGDQSFEAAADSGVMIVADLRPNSRLSKLAGKGKTAAELAGTEPAASAGGAGAAETRADAAAVLSGAQRELIAEAVRAEIRPLRREIIAYKEKNDLQTILGGIGYIVGLFGLWFFLAARRQKAAG